MFINGFNELKEKLKKIYTEITRGGDACLELKDEHDPFSDGI